MHYYTCSAVSESPAHPFLVGVAISVYQNSGGPGSNWEAFEDQKTMFGQPVIKVLRILTYLSPQASTICTPEVALLRKAI